MKDLAGSAASSGFTHRPKIRERQLITQYTHVLSLTGKASEGGGGWILSSRR